MEIVAAWATTATLGAILLLIALCQMIARDRESADLIRISGWLDQVRASDPDNQLGHTGRHSLHETAHAEDAEEPAQKFEQIIASNWTEHIDWLCTSCTAGRNPHRTCAGCSCPCMLQPSHKGTMS